MNKHILIAIIALISSSLQLFGQEQNKTLFDYPQVPDTISTLENRSNYYISHFWDKFDFGKPIKDVEAFDTAFKDYITFFQFAHRNIVRISVNELMNKAQSNQSNFLTIAELAQKNLYDIDAPFQSDEAYTFFASAVVKNTKLKKADKLRYQSQIQKINANQVGAPAPEFEYTDINGNKKSLADLKAENILIFFNNPDCEDCSISRLRLSTNVNINKEIEEGRLIILSIYPGKYSSSWAETAKGYSKTWEIGASEMVDEIYDLRITPNLYLINKDHLIIGKNILVSNLLDAINK